MFEKDEKVTLKIPYVGNPQPKAEWTKGNGEVIRPSETSPYNVEVTNHYVTLRINNPSNEMSDTYKLKLSNELGSDTCEVKIKILGLPSPPRFLIAENVGSDNVMISWKEPTNDGGTAISSYVIERLDCTPPVVEEGQEPPPPAPEPQWQRVHMTKQTTYNDENVFSSHKYQYRVIAQNLQGRSLPSEPTNIITTLRNT